MEYIDSITGKLQSLPLHILAAAGLGIFVGLAALLYIGVYLAAPIPRPSKPSEKTYRCISNTGHVEKSQQLPCWIDKYMAEKEALHNAGDKTTEATVEPASVLVSVVVPAYNEQERMEEMLEEAVTYLEDEYPDQKTGKKQANGKAKAAKLSPLSGFEILIVSDGSTDATEDVALKFAKRRPSSNIRVVSLAKNRGKGGAVTHGFRHVRGAYALFADADGASKFSDLGKLMSACQALVEKDPSGRERGIAIGSRAHLVGSEAVVKRSFLRNLLMHGFHLFLRFLTPAKTAKIRDTQCGFKLFSRSALGDIIPYMHTEGWIFDVEMLMLAESAGIEVAEVHIGWHEVMGSKLNVIKDSLTMAWGLTILRLAWRLGIYSRS